MEEQSRLFPKGMKVYYGRRRFLMIAESYRIDRGDNPYRRLSATLLLAFGEPFELDAGSGPAITTRAALVAPDVPRRRTQALNSELFIFDMPMGSAEFTALKPIFGNGTEVLSLEITDFAPLRPLMGRAAHEIIAAEEVEKLFGSVVHTVCGEFPEATVRDHRIQKILERIDQLTLNQVNINELASWVNLSPSRLRGLFKGEMGCSLGYYARWVALWRAVELWKQGKAMTDMAHEAGFYDLAHLDRVYREVLGMNPTALVESELVMPMRCWS